MIIGLQDSQLAELTHQALKGVISLVVEEGDGYGRPLCKRVADVKKQQRYSLSGRNPLHSSERCSHFEGERS